MKRRRMKVWCTCNAKGERGSYIYIYIYKDDHQGVRRLEKH